MTTSNYYPVFIDVRGGKCLVVGGGEVALRKVQALLGHGAEVQVISPALCPELTEMKKTGLMRRNFLKYTMADPKFAIPMKKSPMMLT